MKSLFVFASLISLACFSTSCNKKFNCQCKDGAGKVIHTTTVKSYSEHTARPQCEGKSVMGYSTCTLY